MKKKEYRIEPIPAQRRFAIDAGRLGRGKHIVHGLAEVDVTEARRYIRQHEAKTGEKLSFTAFVIFCLGKAINHHQELHAYRNWRGHLVIYDEVNVTTMIEAALGGRRVPMPLTLKAVNKRSFREVHEEIRAAQAAPRQSKAGRFMRWFLMLPWILRKPFYWVVMRFPQSFREYSSPVMVTAVGMFSRGASWAITMPNFTLTVALGGVAEKPGVVDGQIAVREYLHVTVSVDHDVVDGAPAARFGNEFMHLLESGYGLIDPDVSSSD